MYFVKWLKSRKQVILFLILLGMGASAGSSYACGYRHWYRHAGLHCVPAIVPASSIFVPSYHVYHRIRKDVRKCYRYVDNYGYYHTHCYYRHYYS
jgi:hypothetical protein